MVLPPNLTLEQSPARRRKTLGARTRRVQRSPSRPFWVHHRHHRKPNLQAAMVAPDLREYHQLANQRVDLRVGLGRETVVLVTKAREGILHDMQMEVEGLLRGTHDTRRKGGQCHHLEDHHQRARTRDDRVAAWTSGHCPSKRRPSQWALPNLQITTELENLSQR